MRMRKGGYGGGKRAAGPGGRGGRGTGRDRDERIKERKKEHFNERSGGRAPERGGRAGERAEERTTRQSDVRVKHAPKRDAGRGRAFPARPPREEPMVAAPPPPIDLKPQNFSTSVQNVTVTADESGMRVDRFFEARSGLSFGHIQRIIRKGEVRVNGKRTGPESARSRTVVHSAAAARSAQAARRRAASAEGPRLSSSRSRCSRMTT